MGGGGAAGTASALLVSRSATKGTRVYRLRRDDELLRLMLLVISRLWLQHCRTQRPPPSDCWSSWREHHELLARLRLAAASAELVATLPAGGLQLPGVDTRWFLD